MNRALLLAMVVGCNKSTTTPDTLTETGWFDGDTGDDDCPDRFVATVPLDGQQGWYWRDRPQVFTDTANHDAYEAWLVDDRGERIDTTLAWDDGAGQSATLEWDGHLEANTDYALVLKDCSLTQQITFRTSDLGTPLSIAPGELMGSTYLLDLAGAVWVEPAAVAGLIQLYFTTPVLLGVKYADADKIDLVGAPGVVDALGNVRQDDEAATWDFPLADFGEAPWLDVQSEYIVLQYTEYGQDVDIPVEDFSLQATFVSDGSALRAGVLTGIGDTRELGTLLNDPRPEAMCELAESLGVTCVPCTDGGPYCLNVRAEQVNGDLVPGLLLVEQD